MTTTPLQHGDIIRQKGGRDTYKVDRIVPEKVSTVYPGRIIDEQVYCHIIEANTRDGIRIGSFHAFAVDDVVVVAKPKGVRRVKSKRKTPRTARRRVPPKR